MPIIKSVLIVFLLTIIFAKELYAESKFIPANHKYIQYFGRWDFSDPLQPKHSWPGVYIYAEFTGTSIGIRINDVYNFYNVYLDDNLYTVFKGNKNEETDYILADSLADTKHTFLFSKRNILFDQISSFSGLLLDKNGGLIEPKNKSERKIEFIGDSFTAAESNEAKVQELEWLDRIPVTNIDKGFAPLIAKHYNAHYTTICRSGIGMVCDWQGNTELTIPKRYDRTLMEREEPKWDFSKWIPDVIVIALGLNDYSGLKDSAGQVSAANTEKFINGYVEFISILLNKYNSTKILIVAPYVSWLRTNLKLISDELKQKGFNNIYYTSYDYFKDGYVAYGHPTVETHKKMADQIIKYMDTFRLFLN
jgi:hypothetical protein